MATAQERAAPRGVPRLTISIVTHNSVSVIAECLGSLGYLAEVSWCVPVIVVADNASWDGTVAVVRSFAEAHPRLPLRVVASDENGGWSAGNELAVHAGGEADYVLLCNPDAQIDEESLRAMVSFMQDHGGAGICAPFVSSDEGLGAPGVLPAITMTNLLLRDPIDSSWGARRFQRALGAPAVPGYVQDAYATGAMALIRYSALVEAGMFDASYFMYFDDVDLSRRIVEQGYRIALLPTAHARHVAGTGSKEAEGASSNRWGFFFASELVYVEKWYGPAAATALACYLAAVHFNVANVARLVRGRRPLSWHRERAPAIAYLRRRLGAMAAKGKSSCG